MNLRTFLDGLPRGGVSDFAARVQRSTVYLSQLARQDGREPGPELCVVIERESGWKVRRWDLRPNNWWLIWPELKDVDGAPEYSDVRSCANEGVPAQPAAGAPAGAHATGAAIVEI